MLTITNAIIIVAIVVLGCIGIVAEVWKMRLERRRGGE